uniref:MAM domain-containing protein n=1 Tax=Meloidogyne hapla TaxID=6305 RepID=A0A1I8BXS0_MELHA
MAPYNREPNPAGVALANAMFFWIFILYVFFPCLLCYSLVGVILYMYSKYRTIQDEKEGVMQLQQNYLIQKSNSKEQLMDKYINIASQLNCDFSTNCLWANAPSDGLLDNSDFYLFQKNNEKSFPLQVGPGNSHPKTGTFFIFAGNLTKEPNHATLISAPIACQSTTGILSFDRGHLTVIERPITDCHYLKPNGLCQVEIKRQPQPFRLAIRGFKLNDQTIGSFVLLTKIKYEANLYKPPIFDSIQTSRWVHQRKPIITTSDLNCGNEEGNNELFQECLWFDFSKTASSSVSNTAHWSIGEKTYLWEQLVRTPSKPSGQFYFQFIDPIAEFPLPQLRSVIVPCTQSPSTLSFKFWLSPGIQAQICTLGTDNVALSCVYLNEADVPGPLTVDIDTADHQPFRFAFNVLRVDREANGGGAVIALDEIKYNGNYI